MTHYQNADLLFVLAGEDAPGQAIAASRDSLLQARYTHVAIVELTEKQKPYVIEASSQTGVSRRPLRNFSQEHAGHVHVFRSKKALRNPNLIISLAKSQLGQPYNHGFFEKGPGFYCSQLVTYAFQNESLFHEEKLQFGPNGSILPHWIDYYKNIKKPIPVHDYGSSPNGLIASNNLKRINPS